MGKSNTVAIASSLFGISAFVMGIPGILPDGTPRFPFLIATIVLLSISLILLLISFFDLKYIFHNLRTLKKLGIVRLHHLGSSGEEIKTKKIANANVIKFIAVSGEGFIKAYKNELVRSLCDKKSTIKILLATRNSEFVNEVEATESKNRIGHISPEILKSEAMLREYLEKAKIIAGSDVAVGRIYIGYFNTHLRSSILICDNTFGWLTLNLPPARAIQTPSFELRDGKDSLLITTNEHFDRLWDICTSKGVVTEIK